VNIESVANRHAEFGKLASTHQSTNAVDRANGFLPRQWRGKVGAEDELFDDSFAIFNQGLMIKSEDPNRSHRTCVIRSRGYAPIKPELEPAFTSRIQRGHKVVGIVTPPVAFRLGTVPARTSHALTRIAGYKIVVAEI
jgi:hypothetical protein